MTVLYSTQARAVGGRAGHVETTDGLLKVDLAPPKELGGPGGATNPEQLFAAGYSACFLGAMGFVAGQNKKLLPSGTQIAGAVGIGPIPAGFGITVKLSITLPGMDRAEAQALIDAAHQVCPYSNATRGNIDVVLELV